MLLLQLALVAEGCDILTVFLFSLKYAIVIFLRQKVKKKDEKLQI